mgnify:CR=1 FL=1
MASRAHLQSLKTVQTRSLCVAVISGIERDEVERFGHTRIGELARARAVSILR